MRAQNLRTALIACFLIIVTMIPFSQIMLAQEAEEDSSRSTLILADISTDPAKSIKRFQPLADYLAERLGEQGIEAGEVKVAPDLETMVEWIAAGEVDLYFDSP